MNPLQKYQLRLEGNALAYLLTILYDSSYGKVAGLVPMIDAQIREQTAVSLGGNIPDADIMPAGTRAN